MTVRLRAHHLLCVLTYVGRGYTPAFTRNMTAIAHRLAAGEAVLVVEGPDDICRPLLTEDAPHCLGDSVRRRDAQAARDVAALLGAPVGVGQKLTLDFPTLARLRAGFDAGATRTACGGCEWQELCGEVAAGGFRHALV